MMVPYSAITQRQFVPSGKPARRQRRARRPPYKKLLDVFLFVSPLAIPVSKEQVELARQVGFAVVTHYPIANDMMGVLVVKKKND